MTQIEGTRGDRILRERVGYVSRRVAVQRQLSCGLCEDVPRRLLPLTIGSGALAEGVALLEEPLAAVA